MTSPTPSQGRETVSPDLRSLLIFAEEYPYAYIQAFVSAARSLGAVSEATTEVYALCCVLVSMYKHIVGLRLKHLTIIAAKTLNKPLTLNHVRTIDGFTISQLWPNLILMLEQIEAVRVSRRLFEWHDLENEMESLARYDPDLCALWSLTRRYEREKKVIDTCDGTPVPTRPGDLINALESLADTLLGIERWIQGDSATQP